MRDGRVISRTGCIRNRGRERKSSDSYRTVHISDAVLINDVKDNVVNVIA